MFFTTMKRITGLSLLLLFAFTLNTFTQHVTYKVPVENRTNLFEIQKAFEKDYEGKDLKKAKGWKQYKRWEYFWKSRVMPDGTFPDNQLIWTEYQKARKERMNTKKKDKTLSSTWENLGPSTSPGGYAGLGRLNCVRESPGSSTILWAGAASGGLWKTTDGGSNWSTNTDQLASIGISDIAIEPTYPYNVMYIATGDRDAGDTYSVGVLKSTDGGVTWNSTGLSWYTYQYGRIGRLLMNPDNYQTLVAASNGGIWKTTNGGTNWTQTLSGIYLDMEHKPDDSDVLYACGTTFYRSSNAGSTWEPITSGLPLSNVGRMAVAVTEANSDLVYVVASKYSDNGLLGVYKSTDAGNTFTEVKDDGSPNLLGWYGSGSDAGGQGSYDLCIEASPSDASTIFVGGVNIWMSTTGGGSWSPSAIWTSYSVYNPTPPGYPVVHADHHDLHFIEGTTTLISSHDGGINKTTSLGASWTYIGSGIKNTQIYKIGITEDDPGLVIAGCQDNGTKLLTGGTWYDVVGGDGMECIIDHSNSDIIFASLYYGDIQKSTDGGSSFNPSTTGITEEGAWVTPFAMDPDNANVLWAGYRNIFKTTNGGGSWTRESNFGSSNTFEILKIAPSNTDYIVAAYSNGSTNTVKRTTTGGSTWGTLAVPSGYMKDFEFDPADDTKFFVCYGSYVASNKVQYSTNSGSNWTNITGNLPNVPINCILKEVGSANDRLWVGTDIGVYYCDNMDANWQQFNDGLPNVVVTELAINYTAQKLVAATYGRGLWRVDLPGAPVSVTLNTPADEAVAQNTDGLVLSWNAAAGATSYKVQVSASASMTSPIVDETGVSATNYTVNGLDNSTEYFWRVQGEGSGDYVWSDIWSFTTVMGAPELSSPADEAVAISVLGELEWLALTGATSYKVQLSSQADFAGGTLLVDETGVSGLTYDYSGSGLAYNTEYYWKVYGEAGGNTGAPSDVWLFRTQIAPPDLTYPANGDKGIPVADTLKWDAAPDADSYNVFIAKDALFSDMTEEQSGVTDLFYVFDGLDNNTIYYWRIQSVNADGDGGFSDTRSFTTVIGKPVLSSPAHEATNTEISGNLAWEAVDGADSYSLILSLEDDFSANIEIDMADITDLDYPYGPLAFLTSYYWKVKAANMYGESEWSDVSMFTTIFPSPVLLTPEDESTDNPLEGQLTFEAVDGASTYNLQLSLSNEFSAGMVLDETEMTETSADYTGLSNNTTYYWRASASDADGNTSPWSDIWSFVTEAELGTVALTSPANNSTDISITPILKWNELDGASSYEYELATDNAFTTIVATQAELPATQVNISEALQYETQYFWRVRAMVGGENTNWSSVWSFTTSAESIELSAPVLSTPANNSTGIARAGQFTWQAVMGAETYYIQVSTDDNFSTLIEDEDGLTATSFAYDNYSYNTSYYWRVKALAGDDENPWSAVWTFTTEEEVEVPDDVELSGPENNSDDIKENDELIWNSVEGALYYTLEIAADEEFTDVKITEEGLTDTVYVFPGLSDGQVYYWRVKAVFSDDETGWSQPWKFITESEVELVTLLSPVNGALDAALSGTLEWSGMEDAESFSLQLSETNDFTGEAGDGSGMIYDQAEIATESFAYSGLTDKTTYYWRVNQIVNGQYSAWSEVWSFTAAEGEPVEDQTANVDLQMHCYPNPFSKATNISFELPEDAIVNLTIYNTLGEKIDEVISEQRFRGQNTVNWVSDKVANGKYVAKLVAGNYTATIVLVVER